MHPLLILVLRESLTISILSQLISMPLWNINTTPPFWWKFNSWGHTEYENVFCNLWLYQHGWQLINWYSACSWINIVTEWLAELSEMVKIGRCMSRSWWLLAHSLSLRWKKLHENWTTLQQLRLAVRQERGRGHQDGENSLPSAKQHV